MHDFGKHAYLLIQVEPVTVRMVQSMVCSIGEQPYACATHLLESCTVQVRTHVGGYVKAVKLWCSKSFHRRDQLPQAAR